MSQILPVPRVLSKQKINKIVELRYKGSSIKEIQKQTGISVCSINRYTKHVATRVNPNGGSHIKLEPKIIDKMVKARSEGVRVKDIMKIFKVPQSAVEKYTTHVSTRSSAVTSKEEVQKMIDLRIAGFSIEEICKRTNKVPTTVCKYTAGLKTHKILNGKTICEMIKMRSEGAKTKEICELFNVSHTTVNKYTKHCAV